MKGALLVLAALAGAGCGRVRSLDAAAGSPEAVEARALVDMLARGDVDALVGHFDGSLRTGDAAERLRQVARAFPAGVAPTRVRLVGFTSNRTRVTGGPATETVSVTHEYNYPGANALAQVVFQRVGEGARKVVGLHADPLPAPLAVVNALTLAGKGPIHYLFLLMMVSVATITIVAGVVWVRGRRSLEHRWLWLLAICVGACKIALNWTSGAVGVQVLTVQALSLSVFNPGVDGPWTFALSIPAGAIAFLARRPRGR